jgi:hypothetical protein
METNLATKYTEKVVKATLYMLGNLATMVHNFTAVILATLVLLVGNFGTMIGKFTTMLCNFTIINGASQFSNSGRQLRQGIADLVLVVVNLDVVLGYFGSQLRRSARILHTQWCATSQPW